VRARGDNGREERGEKRSNSWTALPRAPQPRSRLSREDTEAQINEIFVFALTFWKMSARLSLFSFFFFLTRIVRVVCLRDVLFLSRASSLDRISIKVFL